MRRWVLTALAVVAGVAALLFWLGLSGRYTVLLAVSLLLVVALIPTIGVPGRVGFARLPYQRRDGARREVSSLSWMLYGDQTTLRGPAVHRLHAAGRRACGHAGIDLDSAAGRRHAAEVLGAEVLAFLDDPTAVPVDARRMGRYLTAFERLDLRKGLV